MPAEAPLISAVGFVSVVLIIASPCCVRRRLSRRRLSSVPRSVRERRGRLVDEHRVGPPDDLDRVGRGACLARGGERQALVGAEHGHDAHGHSVLVLFRESGDDTKAVALDSVVGDTGHIAEVDDLALEGLQPLQGAGPMDANASAAARVVLWIVMVVSSYTCIYPLCMNVYIRLFSEHASSMRGFEFTFRCFKVADDLANSEWRRPP